MRLFVLAATGFFSMAESLRKIVVTGATGGLGSEVVSHLLALREILGRPLRTVDDTLPRLLAPGRA